MVFAGDGAFGLIGPAGTLLMTAGLVYLIGCFGVMVFFNVPMYEAIAGMETTSGTTRDYWLKNFVLHWTFGNSARTLACTISAALLLFGLLWMTQSQTTLSESSGSIEMSRE